MKAAKSASRRFVCTLGLEFGYWPGIRLLTRFSLQNMVQIDASLILTICFQMINDENRVSWSLFPEPQHEVQSELHYQTDPSDNQHAHDCAVCVVHIALTISCTHQLLSSCYLWSQFMKWWIGDWFIRDRFETTMHTLNHRHTLIIWYLLH